MTLGALAEDHRVTPHTHTLYTHKVGCTIERAPEAEMLHEKQVKPEGHRKSETEGRSEETVLWIEEKSWVNR